MVFLKLFSYIYFITFNLLILTSVLFFYLAENEILLIEMLIRSTLELKMASMFMLDKISLVFSLTVSFISSAVMFFSREYMLSEKMINKFFICMFFFISSMIFLSFSADLFWLMIGWDGLGLTSFVLILFFQNWKSLNSGMVTFMTNRFGDMFMIMAIILMINTLFLSSPFWCPTSFFSKSSFVLTILSILLMTAGISKSAQLPFSAWLPLAMAAPTPVSALVHSSTLVTAGVFLTIRFFPLINNFFMMNLMLLISSMTMIMSSLTALFEFDLKKIIALSTLSHIGFMMMFISIGNISACLIHMFTHAIFKSMMFMSAGIMIHNSMNIQDIRHLFCPPHSNPHLCSCFMISTMSMMGIPFMSGFYSKDFMILTGISFWGNYLVFFSTLVSAFLTCCYSIRLSVKIFLNPMTNMVNLLTEKDLFKEMSTTLFIMSIFSSIGGSMMIMMITSSSVMTMSFMEMYIKSLLILLMISGMTVGYLVSNNSISYIKFFLFEMVSNMFFIGFVSSSLNKFYLSKSVNLFMKNDVIGMIDKINSNKFQKEIKFIYSKMKFKTMPFWIMSFSWVILIYSIIYNMYT